jgi:putative RecB family exonuclease
MLEPEPRPIRRSVSQLTSYAQCAESYRLQKVAKAPQRPASWFHMGVAAHEGIEKYEASGRTMTTAEAVEVFHQTYDAKVASDLERWPEWDSWMTGGRKGGEQDMEDRRVIGAYQVEQYVEYAEEHAAEWRIIASEVEFVIELGNVDVLGYIDQVRQYADGTIEVDDLKGGSSIPGSAFQLGVYGLAAEEYMGIKPTSAAFIKLARPATARGKAKPTTELRHDLTPWTREHITRLFSDFDKAERQGLYLPNPQDQCERTCGVAQWCSVPGKGHGESAAKFSTIRTRQSAVTKEVAA